MKILNILKRLTNEKEDLSNLLNFLTLTDELVKKYWNSNVKQNKLDEITNKTDEKKYCEILKEFQFGKLFL